jgi:hypothetical protein
MDNVDGICLDHIIMRYRNRAMLSLYRDMQEESTSSKQHFRDELKDTASKCRVWRPSH